MPPPTGLLAATAASAGVARASGSSVGGSCGWVRRGRWWPRAGRSTGGDGRVARWRACVPYPESWWPDGAPAGAPHGRPGGCPPLRAGGCGGCVIGLVRARAVHLDRARRAGGARQGRHRAGACVSGALGQGPSRRARRHSGDTPPRWRFRRRGEDRDPRCSKPWQWADVRELPYPWIVIRGFEDRAVYGGLTKFAERGGRGPFVLTAANEVGTLRPCAWGVPWLSCVPSHRIGSR